ncbi:hypothetical protein RJ55_04393 [Drechmeria coniospora]|nr:hypothetical protein RJ55_04393 [Drechmeria coniospora]
MLVPKNVHDEAKLVVRQGTREQPLMPGGDDECNGSPRPCADNDVVVSGLPAALSGAPVEGGGQPFGSEGRFMAPAASCTCCNPLSEEMDAACLFSPFSAHLPVGSPLVGRQRNECWRRQEVDAPTRVNVGIDKHEEQAGSPDVIFAAPQPLPRLGRLLNEHPGKLPPMALPPIAIAIAIAIALPLPLLGTKAGPNRYESRLDSTPALHPPSFSPLHPLSPSAKK